MLRLPPRADQIGTAVCFYLDSFLCFKPANGPTIGSEWSFTPETLQKLYGTMANYRRLAGLAIKKQIQAGFLLPEDAEVLRRETVENVVF